VSWLHASYGVGAALGPMLMTAVLAAGLSWRWGYMILGALIGVLGLGFAHTTSWWEAAPSSTAPPPHASLRDSLRRPVLHGTAFLFFVYTGLEAVAGQWAYSLFVEGRGMAGPLAGLAVSLYWCGLTLGRMASGVATHRIHSRRILQGGLVLAPLWAALLAANAGEWLSIAALGLLGFTVGPVFPLLIAETPGRFGEAHSANAVGVQIAAGSLGWAMLPAIAGVLAQRLGLESVPPFLLGSALAVLLLHAALIKVPLTLPRARELTMPIRSALVVALAALAVP
jgi:fucose permease